MKCGNCHRFVGYGMLAGPQVGELSAARARPMFVPIAGIGKCDGRIDGNVVSRSRSIGASSKDVRSLRVPFGKPLSS